MLSSSSIQFIGTAHVALNNTQLPDSCCLNGFGVLQGLNRVQQAPGVSKAMHSILYKCQRQIGNWVGSSVIHLGDHNVPNALMFIDKYTQVQLHNAVL